MLGCDSLIGVVRKAVWVVAVQESVVAFNFEKVLSKTKTWGTCMRREVMRLLIKD